MSGTQNTSTQPTIQALYLSHGGGPLPLLGDEGHVEMVDSLKALASRIQKPQAIIVISAHWEAEAVHIQHMQKPDIIYDYYGFPEAAYRITYPAVGHTELAEHLHQRFSDKGIDSQLDDKRGYDHGVYVPLKIMYPEADIPCIQLSLLNNLDPQQHINIGKAIAQTLADKQFEHTLVIGSGFSFHNMRAFHQQDGTPDTRNQAFEAWLIDTMTNAKLTENERTQRLIDWKKAPYASYCHPREEHLIPLHVCYGLTQKASTSHEALTILGKKGSMYVW